MAAFATAADLATRLGLTLTAEETTRADDLLTRASDLVRDAAKLDADPDPVPGVFGSVALEAVVRVWVNPGAVVTERHGSESVQYSQSDGSGLLLTNREERAIRRAAGRLFRSVSQAWPDEELAALSPDEANPWA